MKKFKLLFLNATEERYPIRVIARHCLHTQEREVCSMFSVEYTICTTWPLTHVSFCSNASLVEVAGILEIDNNGCNRLHLVDQ